MHGDFPVRYGIPAFRFGELAKVGSQYVASGSHATSRVQPSVDGVDGVDPFGRKMHHKVALKFTFW
jgi:hypothetical protein